ncbi:MAG TPA: CIA30 family protein [Terriglobia bacterium]|nr:CIA30 family protein [Terriglobia bacterium]
MIPSVRIALMSIKLVMRTKVALFFTFLFPTIFLFVYSGIFARGNPQAVLYFFGPVVTLQIMGSSFWGLGLQSVMQRERGSLRRYRLAPIGPGSMVFSSLLANYLLELPTLAMLVFCARVFFHMPLQINPLTLLGLVTVGTFAFAGFGLTIASVANTMQEAQVYNNVVWFTLLFLSGVTVPLPMLSHWIQRFAAFLPATYLVTSFQAIMVGGQSLFEHRAEMLVLLISGTFGLLFAWKLFRWEKEEKISTRAKFVSISFVVPFLVMGFWMNEHGNLAAAWEATYSMMSRPPLTAGQPASAAEGVLLNDFENPEEAEKLLKTWQVSTEVNAPGRSLGEFEVISPGADGTAHALRFKGRVESAAGSNQGDVTARYPFTLPAGAPNFRGMQFEVRGDTRLFQVKITPSDPTLPVPTLTFIPDSQWQTVRLPAAWLAAPNPSLHKNSLVLEFRVDGPPGNFTLDIDEIRFY